MFLQLYLLLWHRLIGNGSWVLRDLFVAVHRAAWPLPLTTKRLIGF